MFDWVLNTFPHSNQEIKNHNRRIFELQTQENMSVAKMKELEIKTRQHQTFTASITNNKITLNFSEAQKSHVKD